ncbi:MAG TPA: lysyl oxidase family protein [Pseudonocardia sp.]|nr:lysyl oxidase family protein [Pseudonocardia sp.]
MADPSSSLAVGPTDQVPDLVMLPLADFRLSTENGRKVLRFTVHTENKGGTLDLTGSRSNASTASLTVVQNVHQTGGGVRSIRTNAAMRFAVADGHDHWHVSNFAEYKLRPVGSSTWRGAHKEGFCARDTVHIEGNAPRSFPNNCEPGRSDALKVAEGISTGWADRYDWDLWGQFIELDRLALPGDFCVAATADPLHLFAEAPKDNNTTSSLVRITAQDVRVMRQGC